ncbi:N(5)-(carboxyethyl)ornithine synthase [Mycoplasmatota bacterium WC30]
MNKIGFLMSTKENEKRRAILPDQLSKIKNKTYLYFEKGYGLQLGYTDEEYIKNGAHILEKEEILKLDVLCDPKIGDADYLSELINNQIIFGYVHAVQNENVTDLLIQRNITAIAWEDMHYRGRHTFWRNNELAGEAAIMHAFTLYGKLPYDCKVAIIGRGNTSRGAYRILASLGADIEVYSRNTQKLLRDEVGKYDVIVNCVLWDTSRKDHIIYKSDLVKMKKNAMIVDVSCDLKGAIETTIPTSIENPVYIVDDILHYAVDHTPSIIEETSTIVFGDIVAKYIDLIIDGTFKKNKTLKDAIIIEKGKIIDQRINVFQKR